MTLIPWKTKREDEAAGQLSALGGFRQEMDRLFHTFWRDAFAERPWGATVPAVGWDMPIDVEETDKQLTVRAEIPGVKAEDLELSISDQALVISGEKKETQERRDQGYVYQERRFGCFRREVPLPSAVDADNVQAEYKDGVLHVTLQKSQEALPKRIAVKAG